MTNSLKGKKYNTPQFHCSICCYPYSNQKEWFGCPLHYSYVDEAELAKQELDTPRGKRIVAWFKKALKIKTKL